MFGHSSYVGYTVLFTIPPLVLLRLRAEFRAILAARVRAIAVATLALTAYGSVVWPAALDAGAWSYRTDRITGVELFGYVLLDDVVWWALVAWLMSSFVVLSAHFEDRGVDLVRAEIRGLLRSVACAARGLGALAFERNPTIHVAVASFVLLEGALFGITPTEWLFVALAIAGVVSLELVNTAIERLASKVAAGPDEEIRWVKDASAAAVLVASTAAAVIGARILLTRMLAARVAPPA